MPRPFVLLNAAVSLDGKLAPVSRRKVRLGSLRDRARMDRLRASSDAILIGAETLRAEDPPLQVKSAALRRRRVREGKSEHLLQVVVSASLDLPLEARFFQTSAIPRLVVAPASARRSRLERVRRLCDVMLAGKTRVEPRMLLARLGRRGVKRLLVEGGGETFASFLEAGLVDEIHLTVCPLLVGGRSAPTLFDGVGFDAPPFPAMNLDLCRREGPEVYLRYRKTPGPALRA